MRVLVVNAGSSSLKASLVGPDDVSLDEKELDAPDGQFDASELGAAIRAMADVDAVGHRVVHGGPRYPASVRIDSDVIKYLATIADLAPLHIPAALACIETVGSLLPGLPAVACFDTAFHSSMPAAASTYAIPLEWRERYGIRRYGFHGFSHAYSARRAADLLGRSESDLRVVTCHLGAGASLAAVLGGRSVDTTMGFTPLEGLVMATRSGSVDPGVILWLQRHAGISESEMTDALDRRSGINGLAGTSDMRVVLKNASSGDVTAQLALDVYVHRLRACIASMASAMGGLDALVFSGGVGENASAVRAATVSGLRFLDLELDATLNAKATEDSDVSAQGASCRTLVVHAREDVEVAREVRRVLSRQA